LLRPGKILVVDYKLPNKFFKNPYVQSMYARFFRRTNKFNYQRYVLDSPDGDKVDVDFSQVQSSQLAILCHGLESYSSQTHVKGVVSALNDAGFDVAVLNYRSATPMTKHFQVEMGETEDLDLVLKFINQNFKYESLYLVGYSSGANYVLKYVGEQNSSINPIIKKACVISPSAHLKSTVAKIQSPVNWWCLLGFIYFLFRSITQSGEYVFKNPTWIDYFKVRNFYDFYDRFLKEHYLVDFDSFLDSASSVRVIKDVLLKTCVIVSHDDPFLDMDFFPFEEIKANPNIRLLDTEFGGHVGFVDFGHKYFWSERCLVEFFQD